jgi:hypothetical protein
MAPPEADTSEDSVFDVEAAIAEFLADPERLSLPLPHMTTGQRRHARKIAEGNPELKCESFGFGAERQLHIFKKGFVPEASGAANADAALNAKNNFSDVPNTFDVTPMKVRNTFIHIEEGDAVDERMVQTMPRDMFRQKLSNEAPDAVHAAALEPATGFLLADATRDASGGFLSLPPPPLQPAPAELGVCTILPAPPASAAGAPLLAPGTPILVEGLVKAPAFNGLLGVVQGYEQETGRYNVCLSSSAFPSGVQSAKIKGENLRQAMPSPPRYCKSGVDDSPLIPGGVVTPLRLTALV